LQAERAEKAERKRMEEEEKLIRQALAMEVARREKEA